MFVTNYNSDSVSVLSIGTGGALTPVTCNPATVCMTGSSPLGVAVDPSGRYLYVANDTSGSVSVFSIGTGGSLTPADCDPTTFCKTGTDPAGVAVDPSGKYVYVSNEISGSVSVFSIGTGGPLTPVACDPTTFCKTGTDPFGVAVDPSGRYVYVVNDSSGSVSVFSIGTDGALTPVTCDPSTVCKAGASSVGVAVDPSGKYVYVSNDTSPGSVSVFSIGTDGALTPITCDPTTVCRTGSSPFGVAVDPSGRYVYVSNELSGSVSVFSIGTDGALTPVTCDPTTMCKTGSGPRAVAVDPSGKYVYVSNDTSPGSVSVFSIGTGGALTPVTCDPTTVCKTGTEPDVFSLAVGPDRGPTAVFSATAQPAGTASVLDASGSISQDYPIASYVWSFGDGRTQTSTTPETDHVYARPGSYTATLTTIDQAGCSLSLVFTGQTASCNGSSKARSTHTIPVPPATLTSLRVSPAQFKLTGRRIEGRCVSKTAKNRNKPACKRPIKLKFTYTLNAAAGVMLAIEHKTPGRRVNGRCVKPTKNNDGQKACSRFLTVHGSIVNTGKAGTNSFVFDGRIGGNVLGPGTYHLTATPPGGIPQTVTFRIAR